MKEEIISHELSLSYPPGSLNPIDFNEHYLESVGIIDENNTINRAMLRIGSIGTNVIFSNKSKDDIKVQPTSLRIESKDLSRIVNIVDAIKEKFGNTTIQNCSIVRDVHLIDESYPNSIFKDFSLVENLELDVVQFKSQNRHITLYSCGKHKLHLRIGTEKNFGKRLSQLNLHNDLEIENLNILFEDFKSKQLKI